jgi:hypothetical protein
MIASELIRDAYQEIGKQASEQAITGDMGATAIRYLNRLMAAKSHLGLGFTEVAQASDIITTPEYTFEWMVKALAIRLIPQFGQLDSYLIVKNDEKEAYSSVLLGTQRISPPEFTSNVPFGSGNRDSSSYSKRFYSESDDGLLTETNQQIIVEDDT